MTPPAFTDFALCVKDGGYPESLEVQKVYRVVADSDAVSHGLIRVIDESGEDYLFPGALFIAIDVPATVRKALRAAV